MAALAVALAAGCNGDDPSDDLPPPSSPSPTPSPTLDPEEQAAMETFELFLDAVVAVKTGEDPEGEGLEGLVTRTMSQIPRSVRRDLADGHTYTGDVELLEAEVVGSPIDGDDPPESEDSKEGEDAVPEVWVEACLDGSGFTRVDVDTGQRTGIDPAETPTSHLVTASVWLGEHEGEPAWQVGSFTWPSWISGNPEEVLESC